MRRRVGAIIFEGESIILIKRVVEDRIYWVFPGGEIDEGETKEKALVRECKEELGIDVQVNKLFMELLQIVYEKEQQEYFFLCNKIGGTLGTGTGPEFSGDEKYAYRGTFEAVKVPKEQIKDINLLPEPVKKQLLDYLNK